MIVVDIHVGDPSISEHHYHGYDAISITGGFLWNVRCRFGPDQVQSQLQPQYISKNCI
jgi:hypothetical protein